MYFFDLGLIVKFWLVVFGIGILFLPLTNRLFSSFIDKGYIFSKILGIVVFPYVLLVTGTLRIIPFNIYSIVLLLVSYILILLFLNKLKLPRLPDKKLLKIWIFEESLFLITLLFWSYVKGFQPDINGLEKFMDFGFINSILRSEYFPPHDMWFYPEPINYYYFGHLQTAFLSKLTGIEPYILYNIMLASIFALCFTGSFSLVFSIAHKYFGKIRLSIFSGILSAFLVTLGGNLHTIYSFFQSYDVDNPSPFWKLNLLPLDKFGTEYWYPNATRFIQNTIHEFPSYSFVVSDLHGHVLDIPTVLFAISVSFVLIQKKTLQFYHIVFFSFITAIMYMTNAWDGIIYSGLMIFIIFAKNIHTLRKEKLKSSKEKRDNLVKNFITDTFFQIVILTLGFFIFTLPFNFYFKPFASGIGFLCAPEFLEGKSLGPLLFEKDHCQKSPLYQLFILWGFFYLIIVPFIIHIFINRKKVLKENSVVFIIVLFFLSSLLLITPEFIYAKDIYPLHYRANTMFKLGYQAYIMLSLISGFAIIYMLRGLKKIILIPIFSILLGLVFIYPYFSIKSYFGNLHIDRYQGLNGISYLQFRYPNDYDAIVWIQENISGQPVIAEAQGDSYTDYGRVSSNTGLPTILGWTVHQWLWRGSYSIPEPRIDDVRALYEDDLLQTNNIINKYNVEYVFVGDLEREKYPNIKEEKFNQLGTAVFNKGTTTIYKINK